MPWNEEWERAAAEGKSVPDGLTLPEKYLFISFRSLYHQYNEGLLTKEQARKEKSLLIKDFNRFEQREKAMDRSMKAWRWLNLSVEKGDCPKCIELKKAFIQFENYF